MSEATPRPWKLRQQYSNRWAIEYDPAGVIPICIAKVSTTVAECAVNDDVTAANAAHIVRCVNSHAALVEACEVAANIFCDEPTDAADFKDASSRIMKAWNAARAALALATETP